MADPPDQHEQPPGPGGRIDKLEELTMFNERAVEDLSNQMLVLFEQLQQVAKRLEAMEGRISSLHDRLENPDPGPEKPPHSA
jgi:uncharacterized coiled-coil protein SlyX